MLESNLVLAQGSRVRLFKSILETENDVSRSDEKRRAPRYLLGENFAFKARLALFQNNGAPLPQGKTKDWSATPVNLSATGASVQISMAAVAFAKEKCLVKFARGDFSLEVPATIAHFRCYSQYSLCGVVFNFPNPEVEQSYLQLLEPVVLGTSLARVEAVQNTPGQIVEQFNGNNSTFTLWRDGPEGPITGFDFRMRQYAVRWAEGDAELQLSSVERTEENGEETLEALTPDQHDEVHWLFYLSIPNLSKAVPADVRKFMSAMLE